MAQVTLQIGGVGNVQVPDSFLQLSPEQQNAQIEEIAAQAGHAASSAAHPAAASGPTELDPEDVWTALVNKESSNQAGVLGPMTKYGRAVGLAQTLPSTAKAMATKLGLPWKPDLLSGTSKEARQYQEMVGKEYFNEGLDRYGGDVRKALRFYNGGPNGVNIADTAPYADSIIQAALGHPVPDKPNAAAPSTQPAAPTIPDVPVDQSATDSTDSGDIPQFTPEQKAQILSYLPKAKSGTDLQSYARKLAGNENITIGNADQVVDYIRKGGDPSKLAWASPEVQQSPPQPSPDASPGHVGAVVARGLGQGLVDLPSMVDQGLLAMYGGPTALKMLGPKISDTLDNAYGSVVGDFGKAKTGLDKYLAAAGEGVSGTVAGGAGLEDSLVNLVRSGVGAGLGGQAASDLGLPPWLGAILGGGIAHPSVQGAAAEHIPGAGTRFTKSVASNPLGAHMADIAQGYTDLADAVHPQGAAPRGRQPLAVRQINAVNEQGIKGLKGLINKQPNIPTPDKLLLNRAIDQRANIPLERTPNMGPGEIALSDLPDTVAGNAVKQAIMRDKAGHILTPPYGGERLGPLGKTWNAFVDWGLGTATPVPTPILNLLKMKGGDLQKSRMDAAGKAIKRNQLYQNALKTTGPSGFGPAMQAFYDMTAQNASASDMAKAAKAADIARRKAALQSVQQGNDLISRRIERNIVTPTEGYRGLIYQNTGVTQPVQDVALLHMVKSGELDPKDLSRVMSDPNSLMRGKSKAGLKIMDRIGQLADQGVIQRDPAWKGPPEPQAMPQGVLNWLDAQGEPIRSMGAYAGGIAKNIVREMQGTGNFDNVLNNEEPPKPSKAKTKKKKRTTQ